MVPINSIFNISNLNFFKSFSLGGKGYSFVFGAIFSFVLFLPILCNRMVFIERILWRAAITSNVLKVDFCEILCDTDTIFNPIFNIYILICTLCSASLPFFSFSFSLPLFLYLSMLYVCIYLYRYKWNRTVHSRSNTTDIWNPLCEWAIVCGCLKRRFSNCFEESLRNCLFSCLSVVVREKAKKIKPIKRWVDIVQKEENILLP